jgi:hypothetical protein
MDFTAKEIAALMGGRVEHDSAVVPGPGHSAADRSLSVKPDHAAPDGFVVHSFAGDDFAKCRDHVRDKLGIPHEPRPSTPPLEQRGRIVATYAYHDEHGRLLYEVVRFDPKDFRQRRPDGRGGSIWKLGDVRRVLYRLSELIEAISGEHTVFVVEGEKDVENLAKLNIVATTSPGGANKWRTEYNQVFRSADVVIIPDADAPGRAHGRDVAAQLSPVARRLRMLELPDAKDASDWIAAGGTAEELWALVEISPDWKPAQDSHAAADQAAAGQDHTDARTEATAPNTIPLPALADEARHGIVGDIVKTIGPHSEADEVALLLQSLTLAGNVVGRLPYYQVESDKHRANLFMVLVGTSSKGRKGTSFGRVRAVLKEADQAWAGDRLKGGMSSGEGLINEVRDPVKKWNVKEAEFETVDPGIKDKRLMVVEPEFTSVLSVAERQGNTLTQLIRRAWDGEMTCLRDFGPLIT